LPEEHVPEELLIVGSSLNFGSFLGLPGAAYGHDAL
jgi:hypothetical protein